MREEDFEKSNVIVWELGGIYVRAVTVWRYSAGCGSAANLGSSINRTLHRNVKSKKGKGIEIKNVPRSFKFIRVLVTAFGSYSGSFHFPDNLAGWTGITHHNARKVEGSESIDAKSFSN